MPASAVSSIGGVVSAAAPGGVVTSAPFSDSFTRANGDPGQPWYFPLCVPKLQIVSDSLQTPGGVNARSGILLNSSDLDVTYTLNFSPLVTGVRDDMNFHFRSSACAVASGEHYLVTTQPNTAAPGGGSHGVSIFQAVGASSTLLAITDIGTVHEGDTHVLRVHVHGSTVDVYLDNLTTVFVTYGSLDPLTGQTFCYFAMNKAASSIDSVSFS